MHAPPPDAPFVVTFPDEYVFLGLQLGSQVRRLTPTPDLQLSNALDVVLAIVGRRRQPLAEHSPAGGG